MMRYELYFNEFKKLFKGNSFKYFNFISEKCAILKRILIAFKNATLFLFLGIDIFRIESHQKNPLIKSKFTHQVCEQIIKIYTHRTET